MWKMMLSWKNIFAPIKFFKGLQYKAENLESQGERLRNPKLQENCIVSQYQHSLWSGESTCEILGSNHHQYVVRRSRELHQCLQPPVNRVEALGWASFQPLVFGILFKLNYEHKGTTWKTWLATTSFWTWRWLQRAHCNKSHRLPNMLDLYKQFLPWKLHFQACFHISINCHACFPSSQQIIKKPLVTPDFRSTVFPYTAKCTVIVNGSWHTVTSVWNRISLRLQHTQTNVLHIHYVYIQFVTPVNKYREGFPVSFNTMLKRWCRTSWIQCICDLIA